MLLYDLGYERIFGTFEWHMSRTCHDTHDEVSIERVSMAAMEKAPGLKSSKCDSMTILPLGNY